MLEQYLEHKPLRRAFQGNPYFKGQIAPTKNSSTTAKSLKKGTAHLYFQKIPLAADDHTRVWKCNTSILAVSRKYIWLWLVSVTHAPKSEEEKPIQFHIGVT